MFHFCRRRLWPRFWTTLEKLPTCSSGGATKGLAVLFFPLVCTTARSRRRCGWHATTTHTTPAQPNIILKRPDGDYSVVRIVWRMLPRNGGRTLFLLCAYCQIPRRALYGWQVDHWGRYTTSARNCSWQCRACAGLRYASEGGALVLRGGGVSRLLGQPVPDLPSPRPESWFPSVFTSIDDPRIDEIIPQRA